MKLKENNRTYGMGTNPNGGANIVISEITESEMEDMTKILGWSELRSARDFEGGENGYKLCIKKRITSHHAGIPGDGGENPICKKLLSYYNKSKT